MSVSQARKLMTDWSICVPPSNEGQMDLTWKKNFARLTFYVLRYIRYWLKPNKINSAFSHKYLISFWLNLESPCIDRPDFLVVVHKLNGSERRTHWFLTLFSLLHGLWIFTILQALLRRTKDFMKKLEKKKKKKFQKGGPKRQDSIIREAIPHPCLQSPQCPCCTCTKNQETENRVSNIIIHHLEQPLANGYHRNYWQIIIVVPSSTKTDHALDESGLSKT